MNTSSPDWCKEFNENPGRLAGVPVEVVGEIFEQVRPALPHWNDPGVPISKSMSDVRDLQLRQWEQETFAAHERTQAAITRTETITEHLEDLSDAASQVRTMVGDMCNRLGQIGTEDFSDATQCIATIRLQISEMDQRLTGVIATRA